MKLTPTQGRIKIRKELNKGHGIYVACRYYDVRVKGGVLQLFDGANWSAVASGAEFRDPHGRTLFTYEPVEADKTLTVVSANNLTAGELEVFQAGEVVEVVRETSTQYVIQPLDSEKRVNKISLRLAGYRAGFGVQFKVTESVQASAPVKAFISGHWHAWQGTAKVMLSDESSKELREFDSVDDCVNWLFMNEQKDAARALNAHTKAGKLPAKVEPGHNPAIDENSFIIYDNGGETLDRYTVFPYVKQGSPGVYLGMSEGGVGFSQWGELPPSSQHGPHLGKAVEFRALSEKTQRHILARLKE
ncbi:hypothetical protein [Pseudomonas sp. P8_250]|uniref:hypothetical protein n=1 Tax=Pseudomonas sp. P8_250 TaxID=3043446 RepID=UPI002A35F0EE|nr:hypothetical protein [Pseudomonas sp. P8_250]MDX9668731.1 hypothetical protein [Pseudomonas sp. P8_250]